jgi:hypothetical protein
LHISERDETVSLYTMAEETGGKLFENTNNLNEPRVAALQVLANPGFVDLDL